MHDIASKSHEDRIADLERQVAELRRIVGAPGGVFGPAVAEAQLAYQRAKMAAMQNGGADNQQQKPQAAQAGVADQAALLNASPQALNACVSPYVNSSRDQAALWCAGYDVVRR